MPLSRDYVLYYINFTVQDSNPSGRKRPDRGCGPPNLLLNVYQRAFMGIKRPGAEDNYLYLRQSLRMSAAINLLPLHDFRT